MRIDEFLQNERSQGLLREEGANFTLGGPEGVRKLRESLAGEPWDGHRRILIGLGLAAPRSRPQWRWEVPNRALICRVPIEPDHPWVHERRFTPFLHNELEDMLTHPAPHPSLWELFMGMCATPKPVRLWLGNGRERSDGKTAKLEEPPTYIEVEWPGESRDPEPLTSSHISKPWDELWQTPDPQLSVPKNLPLIVASAEPQDDGPALPKGGILEHAVYAHEPFRRAGFHMVLRAQSERAARLTLIRGNVKIQSHELPWPIPLEAFCRADDLEHDLSGMRTSRPEQKIEQLAAHLREVLQRAAEEAQLFPWHHIAVARPVEIAAGVLLAFLGIQLKNPPGEHYARSTQADPEQTGLLRSRLRTWLRHV